MNPCIECGTNCCLAQMEGKKCKAMDYEARPRGEWEYTTHYARRFRVCSVCKAEKEDDRATGWNFCPCCGADMRPEEGAVE